MGLFTCPLAQPSGREPIALAARTTWPLARQTPSPAAYLPLIWRPPAGLAFLPALIQPPSATPTATPPPTATPLPVTPPASGDWRTYLAYYRALARLPALAENSAWSDGADKHALYMVKNQTANSAEAPGNPWYTVEGAETGPNSLLQLQGNLGLTDRQVLDQWMQWPFHAIEILDPGLSATGFGSYRESAGSFNLAAVLDVRRGLGAPPASTVFPIKWPDHNTTVYLTRYDGLEQPDPLTSCPPSGPGATSGLPILLQIGPGSLTPVVTAHSFRGGATPLPHCVFDETTYFNSVASLQALGRNLLGARDAIVLVPQTEMTPGASYTVSITVDGQTHTWTFNVAAAPP
ncbi:MAG: hypothetical protein IT318_16015 [Anaerolineales bacterium]|nr:hypothetical protein [Anaerolineales bacterium]